jgi:hypothetical protein
MKIDGGCHCGLISYEAEADPNKAGMCNCTDCQKLSGAPFRGFVPVDGATLRLTGQPTIYVKTGESGGKREQAFCPRCGSSIYSTAPGPGAKIYNIRLGSIRQRDQIVPKSQLWVRSQQRWVESIAAIPKVEKQ